jgi:hypothetical protein
VRCTLIIEGNRSDHPIMKRSLAEVIPDERLHLHYVTATRNKASLGPSYVWTPHTRKLVERGWSEIGRGYSVYQYYPSGELFAFSHVKRPWTRVPQNESLDEVFYPDGRLMAVAYSRTGFFGDQFSACYQDGKPIARRAFGALKAQLIKDLNRSGAYDSP